MFSQWPVLFPITNHYQDFYFMIANKFLGAVGLVQMHLIERALPAIRDILLPRSARSVVSSGSTVHALWRQISCKHGAK